MQEVVLFDVIKRSLHAECNVHVNCCRMQSNGIIDDDACVCVRELEEYVNELNDACALFIAPCYWLRTVSPVNLKL